MGASLNSDYVLVRQWDLGFHMTACMTQQKPVLKQFMLVMLQMNVFFKAYIWINNKQNSIKAHEASGNI